MSLAAERLHRALYGFYLRLCRDEVRAEDLAAAFHLKCMGDERLQAHTGEGRLSAYLVRAARNLYLDELRRERRGPRFEPWPLFRGGDGELRQVEPPAPDPAPEEIVERREQLAVLESALGGLDPDDHRALRLWMQGMDGAEAALAMGLSHDAYRQRKHRALARLRAELLAGTGAEPLALGPEVSSDFTGAA